MKKNTSIKKTHVINNDGVLVQVDPGTKGAINEHLATVWLMKQGYDVFKNQSPIGRADLIAVDWHNGEWLIVDVKSRGYDPSGSGIMSDTQWKQAAKYADSNVKYLIVDDDGSCKWYDSRDHVNDNREMWSDPLTSQRFTHPRYDMTRNSWSFFSHWVLKNHRDKLTEGQAEVVKVTWQSTMGRGRILTPRERIKLMAIHRDIYQKITGNDPGVGGERYIKDDYDDDGDGIRGVAA